jgi:hypothetical protein
LTVLEIDRYAIQFPVCSSGPHAGEGMTTMANVSMLKEAIIACLIAAIAVPLLWALGSAIDPDRNIYSPGLDLAIMTIVGAGSVMLLRSIWRDTANASTDQDRRPAVRERYEPGNSYQGELCQQ